MKKNIIKANGEKYLLNFTPIQLKEIAAEYADVIQMGKIRTIKSYFSQACLQDENLKKEKSSFSELISLFANKANQLSRLGATYVFGAHMKSIILHKAADTVKRTNTKLERDLLSYILHANIGEECIYLEFVPGFIVKIKGARSIEVLFDFRENIRNY